MCPLSLKALHTLLPYYTGGRGAGGGERGAGGGGGRGGGCRCTSYLSVYLTAGTNTKVSQSMNAHAWL